jgi:hypothetical protein
VKKISTGLVAVLAVALSACGTAGNTADTTTTVETTTTTTTVPEMTQAEKENFFVTYVGEAYPDFVATMGKKPLVDLTLAVCDEIEFHGLTTASLTDMLINANLAIYAGEIGYAIGAGIPLFCPQNQWFIDTIG